jgi:hypothetical protein
MRKLKMLTGWSGPSSGKRSRLGHRKTRRECLGNADEPLLLYALAFAYAMREPLRLEASTSQAQVPP